jgi:hypothetical protein
MGANDVGVSQVVAVRTTAVPWRISHLSGAAVLAIRRSGAAPPHKASVAAAINKPPRNDPVDVRTDPITAGPKNPPIFPIELISAMPAAAAVPCRNLVGMAQNGPTIEDTDNIATPMAATETESDPA